MPAVIDEENRRVDNLLGVMRPPLPEPVESPEAIQARRQIWAATEAVPVLISDRTEGIDNSWTGVDVRTLVRGEHSAARFSAHSIILDPGAGLQPHYLADTHTYVLVTAGAVALRVGDRNEVVGMHSLGYVPPRTRLGFRNASELATAKLVLVYAPAGADLAFSALHARCNDEITVSEETVADTLSRFGFSFDDAALDNDAKVFAELPHFDFDFRASGDLDRLRAELFQRADVPRIIVTTPDEYDAASAGASRRKELIGGDETAGNAMLNMLSGLPGFGAPVHHQPTEDEFFFITGGELQMTCGNATTVLTADALAYCPRNCTHGFRNIGQSGESRFVTLNAPAGHERTMAAVRAAIAAGVPREEVEQLCIAGGFIFHSIEEVL